MSEQLREQQSFVFLLFEAKTEQFSSKVKVLQQMHKNHAFVKMSIIYSCLKLRYKVPNGKILKNLRQSTHTAKYSKYLNCKHSKKR